MLFTFIQVYVSEHYTCPFGASGSVYAWERVARGIQAIANNLLGIPVLVYVDDYFAIDWYIAPICRLCYIRFCIACSRPDCMEHSMLCFARLVRAILGQDAVAKEKAVTGSSGTGPGMREMRRWCHALDETRRVGANNVAIS